eukprot:10528_1
MGTTSTKTSHQHKYTSIQLKVTNEDHEGLIDDDVFCDFLIEGYLNIFPDGIKQLIASYIDKNNKSFIYSKQMQKQRLREEKKEYTKFKRKFYDGWAIFTFHDTVNGIHRIINCCHNCWINRFNNQIYCK